MPNCVFIAIDFAVDWILCLCRAKVHTVDGPFIAGAVLSNVLDRFAERGHIFSYLIGTNGWLWVKMATVEQAARVAKRLDGVAIMQGTVMLAAQHSSAVDWPTDLVPVGVMPTPEAEEWNRPRGRSGQAVHDRFMKYMEKRDKNTGPAAKRLRQTPPAAPPPARLRRTPPAEPPPARLLQPQPAAPRPVRLRPAPPAEPRPAHLMQPHPATAAQAPDVCEFRDAWHGG